MFICIYSYTYINMHIYICIETYICINTYIYMYRYIYIYTNICIYIFKYIYMYRYTYIYIYLYIYRFLCIPQKKTLLNDFELSNSSATNTGVCYLSIYIIFSPPEAAINSNCSRSCACGDPATARVAAVKKFFFENENHASI